MPVQLTSTQPTGGRLLERTLLGEEAKDRPITEAETLRRVDTKLPRRACASSQSMARSPANTHTLRSHDLLL